MKRAKGDIKIGKFIVPAEVFTKRFAPCDLAKCGHACCRYGAVVGGQRIKRIKRALPELYPMMRPEAVKAVMKKGFHLGTQFSRSDMNPSHRHYYMRTVKKRCVFLNFDDKGGCALQKYSAAKGMKYQLKPEGCWGFPFDLVGNRIAIYKWDKLQCLDDRKNRKAPPIYVSCRKELAGFMGAAAYKKLLRTA